MPSPATAGPSGLRIAVIGAGLAGLAAAWLLGRRHEVLLLERQTRPGFTAANVELPDAAGRPQRVDVPLRVFYPGYYPTLTRLYEALGVASEPVSYAASFAGPDGRLYFRYRNWRLGDRSIGWLAPRDWLLGADARAIVAGLLRFHREMPAALARGELGRQTIGEAVARGGYPPAFVERFLLPAIATVCTCSLAQASGFPAAVVVDYLARGLSRQAVRRALDGADGVQARLLQGIPGFRGGVALAAVVRETDGVCLRFDDGAEQRVDHVVFATGAHQARRLLHDAGADEAEVLEAFRYVPVEVLTHTDATLLPPRERDWSPVNLWLDAAQDVPESTIWINAVQPALRGAPPVFQTVHPLREPAPGRVLGRARFERPLVGPHSARALAGLQALHRQPGRRVWFCGSYAQAGIPLLESAVRSAAEVAGLLGAGLDGAWGG